MTSPIHISDAEFQAQTAEGLTLVDFWAPWCGPCLVIAPALEELAHTYAGRVRVVKVNVDDNPVSAAHSHVRSIPTLVLLRDGVPVDTLVGARPKRALQQLLDRHLAASQPSAVGPSS